jgi:hypothetical protein
VRTSILGCCALLLAVSACCHAPPAASVVWTGDVPPLLCPPSNPQIKPATVPGVYLLQIANDSNSDNSYAFLIFVSRGSATVQNVVGPFVKDEDWAPFYNALGALGSARPGGFWCDNITQDKPGNAEGFNALQGTKYRAENRCPGNPHALLAVPAEERLASGPKPPSPPPPDITGFVQASDTTSLAALGLTSEPRALLASLQPVPGTPAECKPIDRNDPRLKPLGTYIQRAVDAVNLLGPGLK